jgi:CO/xanthine dehydrogenase FAD-binding subunit
MPKTMSDLVSASTRFPNATFWAGGTYIMSRHEYYPTKNSNDIIYLAQVPELKRINRTDRYLEIGSMVTFEQMLTVGKQVLPGLLYTTLDRSATMIVRKQMTSGGAICTNEIRLALPCTLMALQAEVEIKTCLGPKTETKWLDIHRLYTRQGRLQLKKNELVTRIRLGFERENFSYFISSGDPMQNPHESVILSFACFYNQSVINRFRLCLSFPTSLLLVPQEIDMMMQGTLLPLSSSQIDRVVRSVMEEILASSEHEIPPIQLERARGFVESAMHELNAQSLSER